MKLRGTTLIIPLARDLSLASGIGDGPPRSSRGGSEAAVPPAPEARTLRFLSERRRNRTLFVIAHKSLWGYFSTITWFVKWQFAALRRPVLTPGVVDLRLALEQQFPHRNDPITVAL